METHMYRAKDRRARAVDYINNSGKYSRKRRMMIVGIVVLLYICIELLT